MKTHDEVEQEALRIARTIAERELGHEVHLEVEHTARERHGTLFRTFQDHLLSVWKTFSHVDVIVDASGRVRGYVDHEAYREAADAPGELPEGDLERLVADEEVLPPRSRLVERRWDAGPEGGYILVVEVESGVEPSIKRYRVDVNPTRRTICAVRPLEEEG
jgi:hypothetical protein